MKKLIILRGNSGSGKTTVAKELQDKFGDNTMYIAQDMIRRDVLKVKDGKDTLALPLLKELLVYGNKNCEVVILEGIMYAEWYNTLFELANSLYGNAIFAYYFDLPFEETLRRHNTRDKAKEFGEEAMRRWWREKDYSEGLSEKIITSEMKLENIVDNIYKDLQTFTI